MVRPFTSSGRSGRIAFQTSAPIEGSTNAQAIHIAASRAKAATALSFSGKFLVAAS